MIIPFTLKGVHNQALWIIRRNNWANLWSVIIDAFSLFHWKTPCEIFDKMEADYCYANYIYTISIYMS
jgi:hypothetical protein